MPSSGSKVSPSCLNRPLEHALKAFERGTMTASKLADMVASGTSQSCVRALGGERVGKIHLEPGSLRGWSKDMDPSRRHRILEQIACEEGSGTAIKRLNALANIQRDLETKRLAKADMHWVQRNKDSLRC